MLCFLENIEICCQRSPAKDWSQETFDLCIIQCFMSNDIDQVTYVFNGTWISSKLTLHNIQWSRQNARYSKFPMHYNSERAFPTSFLDGQSCAKWRLSTIHPRPPRPSRRPQMPSSFTAKPQSCKQWTAPTWSLNHLRIFQSPESSRARGKTFLPNRAQKYWQELGHDCPTVIDHIITTARIRRIKYASTHEYKVLTGRMAQCCLFGNWTSSGHRIKIFNA